MERRKGFELELPAGGQQLELRRSTEFTMMAPETKPSERRRRPEARIEASEERIETRTTTTTQSTAKTRMRTKIRTSGHLLLVLLNLVVIATIASKILFSSRGEPTSGRRLLSGQEDESQESSASLLQLTGSSLFDYVVGGGDGGDCRAADLSTESLLSARFGLSCTRRSGSRSPSGSLTQSQSQSQWRPPNRLAALQSDSVPSLAGTTGSLFGIQFAQAQELAEGLTLAPRTTGNGNHLAGQQQWTQQRSLGGESPNTSGGGGANDFRWPMGNQLEKIKNETKMSALVGQNAIMNCNVHFKDGIEKPFAVNWLKYPHKLPIYIWYAGYPPHVAHGYENRVQRIGQASLNLSHVQPADQGLYECKIYYLDRGPQEPNSNGTWIYLDVQAPPRFVATPPNVSYVQAGDSLHLTCQAESTPKPVLRWYKNKTPIDSNSGAYRLSSDLTSGYSVSRSSQKSTTSTQLDLFIDNVQAGSTTGDYLCLASNSEGSIEARSQVVLAVPAVITTMPRNQTRLEGERVEFTCQAKALPSNITYKWLFNDKPISGLKQFESRHSVRRDGTLIIHSAQRDDEGDYKCQATNGLAHRTQQQPPPPPTKQQMSPSTSGGAKSSGGQKIRQQGEPTAPIYAEASAQLTVEYPARITFSPPVQYLPLGLSGLIRCYVQAAPPVDFYTWTLNNSHFDPIADPNIESLTNGSLLVREVSKKYEGGYRCAPFNKHGSAGSSATMEVRVEEPPKFSLKPQEFYKANVNGHVKIPCDATVDSVAEIGAIAPPKPRVSWRKVNGRSTVLTTKITEPSNLTNYQQSPTVSLTVDESEESEDPHLYPKSPFLVAGQEAVSHANLQQQPQIFTPAEDQQQVVTEQPPVISYAKLPTDRSEYKNSHLLLHGLRKEDHGIYECVIENEVATQVAATMLYIEETTPHAPSNLRVDTKSWSAQVSWSPGYDGGFEQSFVVWYRQIDKPIDGSTPSESQLNPFNQQHHEQVDFNWHSIAVPSGELSSFNVQNLTQDTHYEFYVRAKNIIGEGPRSEIVQASTKRAISGSLTPVTSGVDAAASTIQGPVEDLYNPNAASSGGSGDGDEDSEGPTVNPTVMGIIHLVDVSTEESGSNASASSSDRQSSASQSNNNNPIQSQQQQQDEQEQQSAKLNNNNNSKVYRIIHPSKQSSNNNNNSTDPSDTSNISSSSNNNNKKSPRYEPQDQGAPTSPVLQPADPATAPQNISMVKVAQGWVIEWSEPMRPPQRLADSQVETESDLLSPMSQVNGELPSSLFSNRVGQTAQADQQQLKPAGYSVEFKERQAAKWNPLATISAKEHSMLVKDLRAGGDYLFRVFAHWPGGLKGAPSDDFRYQIPDNRRKPTSAQALSAGVVAGILFFIAAIVLAVCFVNMCNKRRKKRAEKAAYVMMACPVLESHHDIAALNSNSLLKNSRRTSQNRIPGLEGDSRSGHYSSYVSLALGKFSRLLSETINLRSQQQQQPPEPVTPVRPKSPMDRQIVYSSNAPVPVDVDSSILPEPEMSPNNTLDFSPNQTNKPNDDYWVRQPSDRKWGTLTLAASKLAERRAARAALMQQQQQQQQQRPETADSLADELYVTANEASRSWAASLSPAARALAVQRSTNRWPVPEDPSTLPQQHFNAWLSEQLRPPAQRLQQSDLELPPPKVPPRMDGNRQQRGEDSMLNSSSGSEKTRSEFSRHSVANTKPSASLHHRSFSQVNPTAHLPPTHYYLLQQQHYLQHQPNSSYAHQSMTLHSCPWMPFLSPHNYPTFTSQFPPIDANDSAVSIVQNPLQLPQQFNSLLGKRNSIARSTLPLAYNHSPFVLAAPAQQQQPLVATAVNLDLSGSSGQPCPFYPTLNSNSAAANDDPVTENACLGSYKRKKRLPHIEAQFTITPPEMPPAESSAAAAASQSANEKSNEREAVASGRLFVRSLPRRPKTQPPPPPPPPRPPLPRGMPWPPGQRAEQKRLRPPPHLKEVETIGAREKIESYLRHYELSAAEATHDAEFHNEYLNLDNDNNDDDDTLTNNNNSKTTKINNKSQQFEDDVTPPLSSSPVEVDKLEELTFQPYHNLPHLKYTISLPLSRRSDGILVLNETSHLRRSRRSDRSSRPNTLAASEVKKERKKSSAGNGKPAKARLGSSSSCPPPPIEFGAETSLDPSDRRLSLESALDQPTAGHPNSSILTQQPADSLELPSEEVGGGQQVAATGAQKQPMPSQRFGGRQSFYLRDDPLLGSSPRPTASPLPPPVPPHRASSSSTLKIEPGDDDESTSGANKMVLSATNSNLSSSNSSSGGASDDSCTRSSASLAVAKTNGNGPIQASSSNGGECSLGSNINQDQSVDENYEFDRQSSCSSSNNNNNNHNNNRKLAAKKSSLVVVVSPPRVKVSENYYTQVKKVQTSGQNGSQLKSRSRFYDDSMQKEQQLTAPRRGDQPADFYDTVYESIVHEPEHGEQRGKSNEQKHKRRNK